MLQSFERWIWVIRYEIDNLLICVFGFDSIAKWPLAPFGNGQYFIEIIAIAQGRLPSLPALLGWHGHYDIYKSWTQLLCAM